MSRAAPAWDRLGLVSVTLAAATALAAADGAPTANEDTVVIGVRVDTPPFAWQDDETGAFRGYLHDLCIEAVTRAKYHFELVPVTAAERVGIINGNPEFKTEAVPAGHVVLDLLCDPTTISLARLQTLLGATQPHGEGLVFSPIVFVANGSYVTKEGFEPSATVAAENLKSANGLENEGASVQLGKCQCLPVKDKPSSCSTEKGYLRAAYVVGATSQYNIGFAFTRDNISIPGVPVCPVEMASHKDLVKELCADHVQYYFGDIDIAQFYSKQNACKIKPADHPLSYEPYALLVTNRHPGFRPKFIAALYEMFSDQTVSGRFGTYFPELTKSSALSILFRINSIPGMRDLKDLRDSKAVDALAN